MFKIILSVPETVNLTAFWFSFASATSIFLSAHTDLGQRKSKVVFCLCTCFPGLYSYSCGFAWVKSAFHSSIFESEGNTSRILFTYVLLMKFVKMLKRQSRAQWYRENKVQPHFCFRRVLGETALTIANRNQVKLHSYKFYFSHGD